MKKEEITRKRNMELTKELEDVKFQLAIQKDLNSESLKRAQELVNELEIIKVAWMKELSDIHERKKEYEQLISELKDMKNSIKGRKSITRWMKNKRK